MSARRKVLALAVSVVVLLSLMAGSASGMEKVTELSQLDGMDVLLKLGVVNDDSEVGQWRNNRGHRTYRYF